VVANQGSNRLTLFGVDPRGGSLSLLCPGV
jgi:hypothetical protein